MLKPLQEEGWVVCRVFKKKNYTRGFHHDIGDQDHEEPLHFTDHMKASTPKQNIPPPQSATACYDNYTSSFDGSMHLPQLLSPDLSLPCPLGPPLSTHIECSHNHINLLRLTSTTTSSSGFNGDWSFLDKLLASSNQGAAMQSHADLVNPTVTQKYPILHHNAFDHDLLKFSK